MADLPLSLANDVSAVARISMLPALLKLLCQHTGMRFAAVARVTDDSWTACAVLDEIGFGLLPGGQLDLSTTLCAESRAARQPIAIDHASLDPVYRHHHTPRIYGIESYISVPITLGTGDYFGNLCAIDPRPAEVSNDRIVSMFTAYAALIASQIDAEQNRNSVDAALLQSEARLGLADAALLSARETAVLREQFVAILGHDLRNPLAAVAALGEGLARHADKIDVTLYGHRIVKSTRRMTKLIDDVLDFARVRMGPGLGLTMTRVADLEQALNDVVQEIRESHPDRVISADISIAGPVLGNRGRIQQLLSNLLGNAVHHGDPLQPILAEAGCTGGEVVITVTNGGEALPVETQRRIFDPYWRPADSKPDGGLGLGLHICAEIVKAHGGHLTMSSAHHATVFTARWPAGGVTEAGH